MNDQTSFKLWVIKFCLKLIYPKFNYQTFLIFLAIKYRINYHRKIILKKDMNGFAVKTIPTNVLRFLVQDYLDDNLPVLLHKCIVISREEFIQLSSENLFYIDNGVLWLALKLTAETKKKYEGKNSKSRTDNIFKHNLNFMTSEIHKKLWSEKPSNTLENIKIVPVVGSKLVGDNVAFTTENEHYSLVSSFGLNNYDDIKASFHPVPSLECAPKIAATAEVSLVVNDYDLSNDFIKEVLSNYFELPKLVSVGDVFSIDLTPNTTTKYHFKYLDLVENAGKLYFKCKKLDSANDGNEKNGLTDNMIKPYFIVKGVTQLSLGENVHTLKPKDEFFKLDKPSQLSLCPSGLRDKFDQMQETIEPFITGELNELSSSMTSPIIPMLLLTGSMGSGRHLLVKILAKYNGMNCMPVDCNALQSSTAKQTESKINATIQKAKASAPAIVLLDNFEQRSEVLQWFASVMQLNINGEEIKESFDPFDVEIERPLSTNAKEVLQRVAAKTETFLYGDLDTLVHFAMRESYLKQQNAYVTIRPNPDLRLLQEEDFNSALESIRSLQSQHLDAPKIPKVYWEDIGGLEKLKKELLKTIEFPIKYPHLFKNSSLKRSGILLYGPPGCGKTLVAKAVSTELNVSFLSVKGPELLNMYIGQSEENVRKVFESARASSPCIVFLDELDALAPRRGAAGDSGGASDRVVSQLLAELDGVASGEDADTSSFVFIMGATNRPDLLEQSLLRPGRLDKLIYVGPYSGLYEKTSVLKALCRNHKLRPEVKLEDVSAALPDRCTGADLMSVVSTARSAAVRNLVDKLHKGLVKESELSPDSVILGVSELWQGVESFRPSVTDEELAYYESLQSQM
ncbi:hypothetical protein ABMA28_007655 [Loxostege sticticalis]|uniref:Peroxisomal ATPase PEX6 n=1 Tax=Loxostege sticticalis TaxID=481309 RepID=A0ABD0SI95_LOXSC